MVLATGSLPAETGFQRDLAQFETLPGIERGKVWSVEDVMSRAAQLGERVLLLDDLGHWHGCGTAWHLAETTLIDELAGSGLEVHAIGDCVAPRRANNATYEGRKLGLKL